MHTLILVPALVILLNTLWAGLLLLGLPGAWLMIVTAGVADWLTPEHEFFSLTTLVVTVVIAAAGELVEILASSKGATSAGASRKGALGALVGGIVGAVVGTFALPVPVVGSLVGGAGGAFLGSALVEHEGGKEVRDSLKIGGGAALGHLAGMLAKFGAALVVWLVILVASIVP